MLCHVMSCHVISYRVMSYRVISYRVMSCHVMSRAPLATHQNRRHHDHIAHPTWTHRIIPIQSYLPGVAEARGVQQGDDV